MFFKWKLPVILQGKCLFNFKQNQHLHYEKISKVCGSDSEIAIAH